MTIPFFLLVFNILLPYEIAFMTIAGYIAGSLAYDGMHLAFHFSGDYDPWYIPWFQYMKSAHMRHHYRDNSKEFGVIADTWDRIMGTTNTTCKVD